MVTRSRDAEARSLSILRRSSLSAWALVRPLLVPASRRGPMRLLMNFVPARHCPYQVSRPAASRRMKREPVPYDRRLMLAPDRVGLPSLLASGRRRDFAPWRFQGTASREAKTPQPL